MSTTPIIAAATADLPAPAVADSNTAPAAAAKAPAKPRAVSTVPRILEVPTIQSWVRSEHLMLEADTVATLNKYFAEEVDWTVLLAFSAPENTPDAGVVFTTVKQLCTDRNITSVPAEMRKISRAISFIVWQSLVLCRNLLADLERKKVCHKMLGILMYSTVSTISAGVGKFSPARATASVAVTVSDAAGAAASAAAGAAAGAEAGAAVEAAEPKAKRARAEGGEPRAKKPKKDAGAKVSMAGDPNAPPAGTATQAQAQEPAPVAASVAPVDTAAVVDAASAAAAKEAAAAKALED